MAYIDAVSRANYYAIREAISMSNTAVSFDYVLEMTGANARAEAKGKARGQMEEEIIGAERTALAIAENLVNLGLSLETVVTATKLNPEKVKALYEK